MVLNHELSLRILYFINILQPINFKELSGDFLYLAMNHAELKNMNNSDIMYYVKYLHKRGLIKRVGEDSFSVTKKGLDLIGLFAREARDKNRLFFLKKKGNLGSQRRFHNKPHEQEG